MSNAGDTGPVTLFYAYSHKDTKLCGGLKDILAILEHHGVIKQWHDTDTIPGEIWSKEIEARLQSAELVLLILSIGFLASEFCSREAAAAMKRYDNGGTVVVPIVLKPVSDADAQRFLELECLPRGPKGLLAVAKWPDRDEAWANISTGLRKTAEKIQKARRSGPVIPDGGSDLGSNGPKPPAGSSGDGPGSLPSPRATHGGSTGSFAGPGDAPDRPPRPPDDGPQARALHAAIGRAVAGSVKRVRSAPRQRNGPPLKREAVRSLRETALALIDIRKQKRVLWVDDNPDGNDFERSALAKLLIEVITAKSTSEATRLIHRDAEGFDLVISDWERPADGPEAGLALLREIRQPPTKNPNVPFVFYHGISEIAPRRARADQARAAGALGEAVLPSELMALVLRAFEST